MLSASAQIVVRFYHWGAILLGWPCYLMCCVPDRSSFDGGALRSWMP